LIVNADGTGLWSNNERSMNFRMSEVQAVGQPNTAYGNITSGGKRRARKLRHDEDR